MAKSHEIDYRLIGDDMQAVIITLDPEEAVRAEAGAMMFMEDEIEMDTSTGGGVMKGLKRVLAGESFFITTFLNRSAKKRNLAFSSPFPGKAGIALPDAVAARPVGRTSSVGQAGEITFLKANQYEWRAIRILGERVMDALWGNKAAGESPLPCFPCYPFGSIPLQRARAFSGRTEVL